MNCLLVLVLAILLLYGKDIFYFLMIKKYRTVQGLAQGGMFPPQTSLWGRWAPRKERTTLLGISNTVALLGNMISNALTGQIF